MELRQLKHFMAVGDEGGISAAARKLRLTQPALSRQIKSLEEELEVALIERGAHSITLTLAGELLVAEARKLLNFSDAMVEKVRAAGNGEPLRVAYAPSLAGEFLAVAIARFTQFHPRVRVSLFDFSSLEMRTGLAAGKLDLIVSAPCAGLSELIEWRPLKSYGWQLVMAPSHPLAAKRVLKPEDLSGQKLLLYDRNQYPDYWDRITGFFRDRDLQAKIAGEFDGVSSLIAALQANLGVAFLSESSNLERNPSALLIARPLTEQPPRIEVAVGHAANGKTPAHVLSFIEELRQAASEV